MAVNRTYPAELPEDGISTYPGHEDPDSWAYEGGGERA